MAGRPQQNAREQKLIVKDFDITKVIEAAWKVTIGKEAQEGSAETAETMKELTSQVVEFTETRLRDLVAAAKSEHERMMQHHAQQQTASKPPNAAGPAAKAGQTAAGANGRPSNGTQAKAPVDTTSKSTPQAPKEASRPSQREPTLASGQRPGSSGLVQPSNGAPKAAKPAPNKANGTAQENYGPLNMDWLQDEEYVASLLAKK